MEAGAPRQTGGIDAIEGSLDAQVTHRLQPANRFHQRGPADPHLRLAFPRLAAGECRARKRLACTLNPSHALLERWQRSEG